MKRRPRGRLLAPAARELVQHLTLTVCGLIFLYGAAHAIDALQRLLGI